MDKCKLYLVTAGAGETDGARGREGNREREERACVRACVRAAFYGLLRDDAIRTGDGAAPTFSYLRYRGKASACCLPARREAVHNSARVYVVRTYMTSPPPRRPPTTPIKAPT